jgi:hypothetical protein
MKNQQNLQIKGQPVVSQSPEGQQYEEIIYNDKKIYNCLLPDCGKTFKFKSEMKRHLAIHSNERPFTCAFPDCGKTFKRADALSNHFRIHSKSTPFDCPVADCKQQFNTKSALRYHLLKHNGETNGNFNDCDCTQDCQNPDHQQNTLSPPPLAKEEALSADSHKPDELSVAPKTHEGFSSNPMAKFNLLMSRNSIKTYLEDEIEGSNSETSMLPQKSGRNVEETLMNMVNFMMEENQKLKKKLKIASDLLQEKQPVLSMPIQSQAQVYPDAPALFRGPSINNQGQIDIDSFFKVPQEAQDDWEEKTFGDAFLKDLHY